MSVHVSGIIQYLLFCTSFHIHLVASIGISFLYMDEYYSTLWTDHTWFIYSSLGCFHLLAIVNNAAKSRGVQVSLRVPAVSSSRYISRSEMATHPSVLVWRIPGTGEPGGLPSMASHRVGHDWSNLAAAAGAVQRQVSKRGQNRDANLDPCALLSYILFVGSFVHLNKYLSFRLRFFFSTLGTVPICLPEKSLHRAAFKWWPLAAF